jgi:hypothetical protein
LFLFGKREDTADGLLKQDQTEIQDVNKILHTWKWKFGCSGHLRMIMPGS